MDNFCYSGPAYAGFHSGPKPGECRGNPERSLDLRKDKLVYCPRNSQT